MLWLGLVAAQSSGFNAAEDTAAHTAQVNNLFPPNNNAAQITTISNQASSQVTQAEQQIHTVAQLDQIQEDCLENAAHRAAENAALNTANMQADPTTDLSLTNSPGGGLGDNPCDQGANIAATENDPNLPADAGTVLSQSQAFLQIKTSLAQLRDGATARDGPEDGAKADLDRQVKRVQAQQARFEKLEAELRQQRADEDAEAKGRTHSRIWDKLEHPERRAHPSALIEEAEASPSDDVKHLDAKAAKADIARILERVKHQEAGFERVAVHAEKEKEKARQAMLKLPKAQQALEAARKPRGEKESHDGEDHLRTDE